MAKYQRLLFNSLFLILCLLSVVQATLCATISGSVSQFSSASGILAKLAQSNNLPNNVVRQVQIVNSNELNAETNGQDIIISSALWNRLTNNDQRAFVIGHELSHVILGHIEKTQLRRLVLGGLDQYLSSRFQSSNLWNLTQKAGISLIDKRFSRNVEYQADDLGLQLMTKAGYQPHAALQVLTMLEQATRSNRIPEFLQDHPLDKARIQALATKYQLSY